MRPPYFVEIMQELAPSYGAVVVTDTTYGYTGYVEFKNGKRFFFSKGALDINPHGAAHLVKDKDYARQFFMHFGYPTPEQEIIFSPEYRERISRKSTALARGLNAIQAAITFARAHSFPLFVKPNDRSEGVGVAKVWDEEQLVQHITNLFAENDKVLVQTTCIGKDYRIVVVHDEVVLAYERSPLSITGNGALTIEELIHVKIEALIENNRRPNIHAHDERIQENIKLHGLTPKTILRNGVQIFLLDHANLSAGGNVTDITSKLHTEVQAMAVQLLQDMGLGFGAIDLIATDLTKGLTDYKILEINAQPGFQHFRQGWVKEKEQVKNIYNKIFNCMQKN